jgi:tRNA modification GTPase
MDTIFAQSSAPGKSGVAVFRISGPLSLETARQLTNLDNIEPRKIYLKTLTDQTGMAIDHAMITYFKAPHSFTGEDVIELHTHGSIAIANLLTQTILNTGIIRMAEPGEFAKRAFLNGKIDLTSAEGLADLIESETLMQHKQAIRQMGGELETIYSDFRSDLLKIISLLEAFIDFPEEEIPLETLSSIENTILHLTDSITKHLNDNRRGERLRNGLMLTIVGAPNVGKSSLLNFLAQREVAIVSSIAGTTRDIIETHLDIGGYPIILRDTAGLRSNSSDTIEQEGIRRAFESAKTADIKIIMFDIENIHAPDQELLNLIDDNTIILVNKVDLNNQITSDLNPIPISLKQKIGLDTIIKALEIKAAMIARPAETPGITRERHRHHLNQALSALNQCNIHRDLVLATEDIRIAIRYLSTLTGKIEVEEILGEIFSKFCIGK